MYGPEGAKELKNLISSVTVKETYFFREMEQIKDLIEIILPELLNNTGKRNISVWSCACSTGDEPYTIAINLKEVLPEEALWRINILATDIDRKALAYAREGVYEKHNLRKVPQSIIDKYFKHLEDGRYIIADEIKKMVRFTYLNLINSLSVLGIRDVNCVFCRNLLIYLHEQDKIRCIENLYKAIRRGGIIMGKHIFAVDDSSSIRTLVEYSLKSKGFNVTTASDGMEALERLAQQRYDAIVLDINMPRLDGIEVLKRIKQDTNYSNIPVIILTTESQEEEKERALRIGARAYLIKPFRPSELIELMEKIFSED